MDQGFSRWAQRQGVPVKLQQSHVSLTRTWGFTMGFFMLYPHFLAIQHHGAHET